MTGEVRGYARRAAAWGAPLALLAQTGSMARASASAPETGTLDVRFEGLRSARGLLRACLTRNPALFLKCEKDPASFKASVAASNGAHIVIGDVPPGDYALLVLHDENGNGKVDTMLGIPREGVGFSRNPRLMFGPPRFDAVRIHISPGASVAEVKLQYFL